MREIGTIAASRSLCLALVTLSSFEWDHDRGLQYLDWSTQRL